MSKVKSPPLRLKKRLSFTVNGSVWMECNGQRFFGPGPLELLEGIDALGSISQAAKQMGMSYKKAWEIINRLNENSTVPFVATAQGGKNGGGSLLSSEAREWMNMYRQLRVRFQDFLQQESGSLKIR